MPSPWKRLALILFLATTASTASTVAGQQCGAQFGSPIAVGHPEFDSALEAAVTPAAALIGLAGGGLIGLGVGALAAPERWEPAYLPGR